MTISLTTTLYILQTILGILSLSLYSKFYLKSNRTLLFYFIFTFLYFLFTTVAFQFFLISFPILNFSFHFYLNFSFFLHLFIFTKIRKLKSNWYRYLICLPGFWYLGWSTVVCFVIIPLFFIVKILYSLLGGIVNFNFVKFDGFDGNDLVGFGVHLIGFVISFIPMYQSLVGPKFCKEEIHVDLTSDRKDCGENIMELKSDGIVHENESKILRIFQITDAHLGPFMPIHRLQKICENIVKNQHKIDFVFITGDMETVETHEDEEALLKALKPLKEMKGRVVACLGNHDYEVYDKIIKVYKEYDIILLQDEAIMLTVKRWEELNKKNQLNNNNEVNSDVTTTIQVIGSIFSFGNDKHINGLLGQFGKIENIPRILLLHNPSVFNYIDNEKEQVDMVFSGHLHGGQIGIGRITFIKVLYNLLQLFFKKGKFFKTYPPDQGLYGIRKNRLYSHRGTGHYGFPLRMGIRSEQSLITLYF